MSENITIARPYAKAIFDIANKGDMLLEWDKLLSSLSIITENIVIENFLKNKTISYNDKSKIIIDSLKSYRALNKNLLDICINFVKILSYYGRLLCMAEIYSLYKQYMNLKLGRLDAVINIAHAVNNIQKEYIISCLSKRFNKEISALFIIDEKILGGVLIKIGDYTLDGSVNGNLISLKERIVI